MLKIMGLPLVDLIMLLAIVKMCLGMFAVCFLIIKPLVKYLSLFAVKRELSHLSKFKRMLIRQNCSSELSLIYNLVVIFSCAYFYVHAHYVNISLVVTYFLLAVSEYTLYLCLDKESVIPKN